MMESAGKDLNETFGLQKSVRLAPLRRMAEQSAYSDLKRVASAVLRQRGFGT